MVAKKDLSLTKEEIERIRKYIKLFLKEKKMTREEYVKSKDSKLKFELRGFISDMETNRLNQVLFMRANKIDFAKLDSSFEREKNQHKDFLEQGYRALNKQLVRRIKR